MIYVPRTQTRLPIYPSSHYPGPYPKKGICWHHMGAHEPGPISLARALEIQRVNYDYHRSRWGSIDIIEGYDLYDVEGEAAVVEGRPYWSNCDAFSGASRLGNVWIGVEVSGNYEVAVPSWTILEGMVDLAVMLYREQKIYACEGAGHRDFNYVSTLGPSSCPGRNLYPLIPEVMEEAWRKINNKEDDMIFDFGKLTYPTQKIGEKGGPLEGKEVDVYEAMTTGAGTLYADSDLAGDTAIQIFLKPACGPTEAANWIEGGFHNKDNVHGTVYPLERLFGEIKGDHFVTVHVPKGYPFRGWIVC